MRCSGPRLVEVRVRTRREGCCGDNGASCAAVWSSATGCRALCGADDEGGRAASGGEADAWGKSKLPVVKGKLAGGGGGGGGGDGDGGGLGIGDVGARSHRARGRSKAGRKTPGVLGRGSSSSSRWAVSGGGERARRRGGGAEHGGGGRSEVKDWRSCWRLRGHEQKRIAPCQAVWQRSHVARRARGVARKAKLPPPELLSCACRAEPHRIPWQQPLRLVFLF